MRVGSGNQADTVRTLAQSIRRTVRQRATLLRSVDRRTCGRLKAGETLASNLGRVLDLSGSGMRVLSRRRLRGTLRIALWDINRGLTVTGEVVWSKRLRFRRHETGIKFHNITPEIARDLTALGADNRRELG